jgi:hypothetical protein
MLLEFDADGTFAFEQNTLMELEPPSTLPRGWNTERPSRPGSGSVWYIQLQHRIFAGCREAIGEHATGRAGADDDVISLNGISRRAMRRRSLTAHVSPNCFQQLKTEMVGM